ncbi:MAG: DUF58 domain-containing protein, partial [Dehalococcoidia bacterium]
MITVKGVGFLIVALLVYLLARLTQVGWLYLADAILWGIILLSALMPWLGVVFLGAQRRVEHSGAAEGRTGPAEGETVKIELSLRNRAFWPRFFLSAHYDCSLAPPDRRERRFFVSKLPGSGLVPLTSEVVAYQRGQRHLGPAFVESSAPFTLFRHGVRLEAAQPVLIYPQVYPLPRLALVDGLAGAVVRPQKSRVGLETVGSRPYFPGDPRRYIHWRNTARVGRPMVKEFEDPRDQTLHLLFDATQVWGEDRETTLEYGIKIVASVGDYARRHRVLVQIWGGGLREEIAGPEEHGGQTWPQVLKQLALLLPGDGDRLTESLNRLPQGASALAVVAADDLPA